MSPRLLVPLLLALPLLACGDDDDEGGGGRSTTTTVRTTATSAPTTPTTADGEGIAELEALAQGLLITLDELAVPTFADAGYTPFEGANECGVDVDGDLPPDALVGTILRDDTRIFQQEIRVYASATAAAVGFDARVGAFACGTGGQGTAYGEPVDVNDRVGADAAFAVTATNPQIEALLVTALVSDAVVSFVFTRPPGEAPADLPDPVEVAAFGTGKILAALEG